MPLHKLVPLDEHESTDLDSSDDELDDSKYDNRPSDNEKNGLLSRAKKVMSPWKRRIPPPQPVDIPDDYDDPSKRFTNTQGTSNIEKPAIPTRTLQQYHGGPNRERTEYMEEHSALANKGLAVSVEQVSIFLTADNTVVSFFESSAGDIEVPIVSRLGSEETILRKSADASMVLQAIIDAIIDLAIPVTRAYQDSIEELELNVLTG